ncbi:hypothetical protein KACC15558_31820 [Brevibacterium ammoniilyticum]|uniref:4Fe-4S ferredoxin-type domain-containing protein n=1 Tax=Brevibacterium ammoniilyticum TaxID=1046555 RepID=A0ABP9UB50_9MICO
MGTVLFLEVERLRCDSCGVGGEVCEPEPIEFEEALVHGGPVSGRELEHTGEISLPDKTEDDAQVLR